MKRESKIIIGIHWLGNKPPIPASEMWWKLAIADGLKFNKYPETKSEREIECLTNYLVSKLAG